MRHAELIMKEGSGYSPTRPGALGEYGRVAVSRRADHHPLE